MRKRLSHIFNSLNTQLNGTLIVLVMLIVAAVVLNIQTIQTFDNSQQMLNITGLQRSNTYLVASLARRVLATAPGVARQSATTFLQETLTDVENTQRQLRQTYQQFHASSDERALLAADIDHLDQEWHSYIELTNSFLETRNLAEQEDILTQIDSRSVLVFVVTDRLVTSVSELIRQEREMVLRIMLFFVVVTITVFAITVGLVQRILHAINDLSHAAQQFSEGKLAARAPISRVTELAAMARVFNEMAKQLETVIGGLLQKLEMQVEVAEKARAEAEKANNVKSSFLASMSHELRTPLNAVINFTKFVAQGDLGPVNDEQKDILGEVVDSAKHLLNLINDVLDMSKIESGSLKLLVEDGVILQELFDSLAATARSLLMDKAVTVYTDIPEDLPPIRADRMRIFQVLLNIVSNACKFTEKGDITIAATATNDEVTISIRDTGPGIPEAEQALVFQPFQQAEAGLRRGSGTGLGMPISKSLVEAHYGRIWLESAAGKGATFYITLPIQSEQLTPVSLLLR